MTERLREELDYEREARNAALYRQMLVRRARSCACRTMRAELSTRRLLTMSWLDGKPLLAHLDHSLEERNRIAIALFRAWW